MRFRAHRVVPRFRAHAMGIVVALGEAMLAHAHREPLSPWTADEDHMEIAPVTTEVSATLPVGAGTAFEAFADIAQTPRWLSVVQSARVVRTDEQNRPAVVAFLARLERATIGYSLSYRW